MAQVVVMVLLDAGRVLAARRGPATDDAGHWSFPTGTVEPGETQRRAVVRESWEELSVVVVPLRQVWRCPTDDGRHDLHWWSVRALGRPRPDGREVDALRWVGPRGFLDLAPTYRGDRRFVTSQLPRLLRA